MKFSIIFFFLSTDFGLSDFYIDARTNRIKRFGVNRSFNGTLKYMSIAASMCMQYTPIDDLYEIGYSLVRLLYGLLPWEEEASMKEKKLRILLTTKVKFLVSNNVSSKLKFDFP